VARAKLRVSRALRAPAALPQVIHIINSRIAVDIAIQSLEGCTREMQITFAPADLKTKFEEAYRKVRPQLAHRGFRKGHVPQHMLEKMYGEEIEREALTELANEKFKIAVEEGKLLPIGTPELTDLQHTRGESATVTVRFEVRPAIDLQDAVGLEVVHIVHTVKEEEVEAEIDRQRYLESETVEADQILSEDYIATVDLDDIDAATGSPIEGTRRTDNKVYLRRPNVQPELKAALYNTKAGDSFTYEVADAPDAETPLHQKLHATVKKVERVELPGLNDEFAVRVSDGKATTVDAYRALVRTEMEHQWNERSKRSMRDKLAEAYSAKHEFPVPDALVHELLHAYLEDYKRQGMKDLNEREFFADMRPSAEWQAKWTLLREAFIEKNGLTVEDEDIESMVDRDHERLGVDKERLRAFYKKSDQYRDRVLVDKVFDLLEKGATVRTVEG
jgi:trigger factor